MSRYSGEIEYEVPLGDDYEEVMVVWTADGDYHAAGLYSPEERPELSLDLVYCTHTKGSFNEMIWETFVHEYALSEEDKKAIEEACFEDLESQVGGAHG